MCEQTPLHYQNGDIVWVKLSGYWWPGEVVEFDKLPDEIKAGFNKKVPLVTVTFFQEDTYEYVKNLNNICSYNCSNKDTFIKKGMDMHRAKNSFMDKFPADICTAEERTGGNLNILADPKYAPEKKIDYQAEIFGTPTTSKKTTPKPKGRPSLKTTPKQKPSPSSTFVTHPRFLGRSSDHQVRVLMQSAPKAAEDESRSHYQCNTCKFSTDRIDVMVLHNKGHLQGVYTSVASTKKRVVPKKTSKKVTCQIPRSKTNTIEEDIALLEQGISLDDFDDSEDENEVKKRKQKTKSIEKRIFKKTKKPEPVVEEKVDIRVDLLAEWDDDDEDDKNATIASTSADDTLDQTLNSTAFETSIDTTLDISKAEETKKDIQSCFDFNEEEDELLTATIGRKIPRVIPDKRKSTEPTEDANLPTAENDANRAEQIKDNVEEPSQEPSDPDWSGWNDLLESTSVPKIPDVETLLKCSQNFHNSKTIKFPDKTEPVPEKSEVATKLTNPKKRFIKSFEDYEQCLKQEREEAEKESELSTSEATNKTDNEDDSKHNGANKAIENIQVAETEVLVVESENDLAKDVMNIPIDTSEDKVAEIEKTEVSKGRKPRNIKGRKSYDTEASKLEAPEMVDGAITSCDVKNDEPAVGSKVSEGITTGDMSKTSTSEATEEDEGRWKSKGRKSKGIKPEDHTAVKKISLESEKTLKDVKSEDQPDFKMTPESEKTETSKGAKLEEQSSENDKPKTLKGRKSKVSESNKEDNIEIPEVQSEVKKTTLESEKPKTLKGRKSKVSESNKEDSIETHTVENVLVSDSEETKEGKWTKSPEPVEGWRSRSRRSRGDKLQPEQIEIVVEHPKPSKIKKSKDDKINKSDDQSSESKKTLKGNKIETVDAPKDVVSTEEAHPISEAADSSGSVRTRKQRKSEIDTSKGKLSDASKDAKPDTEEIEVTNVETSHEEKPKLTRGRKSKSAEKVEVETPDHIETIPENSRVSRSRKSKGPQGIEISEVDKLDENKKKVSESAEEESSKVEVKTLDQIETLPGNTRSSRSRKSKGPQDAEFSEVENADTTKKKVSEEKNSELIEIFGAEKAITSSAKSMPTRGRKSKIEVDEATAGETSTKFEAPEKIKTLDIEKVEADNSIKPRSSRLRKSKVEIIEIDKLETAEEVIVKAPVETPEQTKASDVETVETSSVAQPRSSRSRKSKIEVREVDMLESAPDHVVTESDEVQKSETASAAKPKLPRGRPKSTKLESAVDTQSSKIETPELVETKEVELSETEIPKSFRGRKLKIELTQLFAEDDKPKVEIETPKEIETLEVEPTPSVKPRTSRGRKSKIEVRDLEKLESTEVNLSDSIQETPEQIETMEIEAPSSVKPRTLRGRKSKTEVRDFDKLEPSEEEIAKETAEQLELMEDAKIDTVIPRSSRARKLKVEVDKLEVAEEDKPIVEMVEPSPEIQPRSSRSRKSKIEVREIEKLESDERRRSESDKLEVEEAVTSTAKPKTYTGKKSKAIQDETAVQPSEEETIKNDMPSRPSRGRKSKAAEEIIEESKPSVEDKFEPKDVDVSTVTKKVSKSNKSEKLEDVKISKGERRSSRGRKSNCFDGGDTVDVIDVEVAKAEDKTKISKDKKDDVEKSTSSKSEMSKVYKGKFKSKKLVDTTEVETSDNTVSADVEIETGSKTEATKISISDKVKDEKGKKTSDALEGEKVETAAMVVSADVVVDDSTKTEVSKVSKVEKLKGLKGKKSKTSDVMEVEQLGADDITVSTNVEMDDTSKTEVSKVSKIDKLKGKKPKISDESEDITSEFKEADSSEVEKVVTSKREKSKSTKSKIPEVVEDKIDETKSEKSKTAKAQIAEEKIDESISQKSKITKAKISEILVDDKIDESKSEKVVTTRNEKSKSTNSKILDAAVGIDGSKSEKLKSTKAKISEVPADKIDESKPGKAKSTKAKTPEAIVEDRIIEAKSEKSKTTKVPEVPADKIEESKSEKTKSTKVKIPEALAEEKNIETKSEKTKTTKPEAPVEEKIDESKSEKVKDDKSKTTKVIKSKPVGDHKPAVSEAEIPEVNKDEKPRFLKSRPIKVVKKTFEDAILEIDKTEINKDEKSKLFKGRKSKGSKIGESVVDKVVASKQETKLSKSKKIGGDDISVPKTDTPIVETSKVKKSKGTDVTESVDKIETLKEEESSKGRKTKPVDDKTFVVTSEVDLVVRTIKGDKVKQSKISDEVQISVVDKVETAKDPKPSKGSRKAFDGVKMDALDISKVDQISKIGMSLDSKPKEFEAEIAVERFDVTKSPKGRVLKTFGRKKDTAKLEILKDDKANISQLGDKIGFAGENDEDSKVKGDKLEDSKVKDDKLEDKKKVKDDKLDEAITNETKDGDVVLTDDKVGRPRKQKSMVEAEANSAGLQISRRNSNRKSTDVDAPPIVKRPKLDEDLTSGLEVKNNAGGDGSKKFKLDLGGLLKPTKLDTPSNPINTEVARTKIRKHGKPDSELESEVCSSKKSKLDLVSSPTKLEMKQPPKMVAKMKTQLANKLLFEDTKRIQPDSRSSCTRKSDSEITKKKKKNDIARLRRHSLQSHEVALKKRFDKIEVTPIPEEGVRGPAKLDIAELVRDKDITIEPVGFGAEFSATESALDTLATVSELTFSAIDTETEMSIEKNLTVVSDDDLQRGQVEIANIPSGEEGTQKMSLASFSVDFTETDMSVPELFCNIGSERKVGKKGKSGVKTGVKGFPAKSEVKAIGDEDVGKAGDVKAICTGSKVVMSISGIEDVIGATGNEDKIGAIEISGDKIIGEEEKIGSDKTIRIDGEKTIGNEDQLCSTKSEDNMDIATIEDKMNMDPIEDKMDIVGYHNEMNSTENEDKMTIIGYHQDKSDVQHEEKMSAVWHKDKKSARHHDDKMSSDQLEDKIGTLHHKDKIDRVCPEDKMSTVYHEENMDIIGYHGEMSTTGIEDVCATGEVISTESEDNITTIQSNKQIDTTENEENVVSTAYEATTLVSQESEMNALENDLILKSNESEVKSSLFESEIRQTEQTNPTETEVEGITSKSQVGAITSEAQVEAISSEAQFSSSEGAAISLESEDTPTMYGTEEVMIENDVTSGNEIVASDEIITEENVFMESEVVGLENQCVITESEVIEHHIDVDENQAMNFGAAEVKPFPTEYEVAIDGGDMSVSADIPITTESEGTTFDNVVVPESEVIASSDVIAETEVISEPDVVTTESEVVTMPVDSDAMTMMEADMMVLPSEVETVGTESEVMTMFTEGEVMMPTEGEVVMSTGDEVVMSTDGEVVMTTGGEVVMSTEGGVVMSTEGSVVMSGESEVVTTPTESQVVTTPLESEVMSIPTESGDMAMVSTEMTMPIESEDSFMLESQVGVDAMVSESQIITTSANFMPAHDNLLEPPQNILEEPTVTTTVEMEMAKLTNTSFDTTVIRQPDECTTSTRLLEILTEAKTTPRSSSFKPKPVVQQIKPLGQKIELVSKDVMSPKGKILLRQSIPGSSKPKINVISDKTIRPLTPSSSAVSVQKVSSKRTFEDFEDIDKFIIQKPIKKPATEQPEVVKKFTPSRGKPTILGQTIIKPSGEVVSQAKPQTTDDTNIFDIDSMPIVLSDQILTAENIDTMPFVLQETQKPMQQIKKLPPAQPQMKLLNKSAGGLIKDSPMRTGMHTKVYSKTIKPAPKTIGTSGTGLFKHSPSIVSQAGRHGKFVIVPAEGNSPTGSKYTVGKRQIKKVVPTVIPTTTTTKVQNVVQEPTGNKIMIVTNNQGQQSRVLLTPAQQKMIRYQTASHQKKAIKTMVTSKDSMKAANIISQTIINPRGQITSTQAGSGLTTIKKPRVDPTRSRVIGQKLLLQGGLSKGTPGQSRTIIIKNPQGQTIRKLQGSDDALLEKQVAEQLEAINRATIANKGYKPVMKKYPQKKTTVVDSSKLAMQQHKVIKSPASASLGKAVGTMPPLAPISPKKPEHVVTSKKVQQKAVVESKPVEAEKVVEGKKPHQLVIQDALGNQTTITEGQILALPSETVDGQPQSYMLVTLDESGNLTPLNNEALMSLDPNLGGDLSNMVLQIDQGGAAEATAAPEVPVEKPVVEEPVVEQVQPTTSEPETMQAVSCQINNGGTNQQLLITGDPVATHKFLESLTEGNTELASLLANAEGNILIHADGQQILINTDADNQMLLHLNSDAGGTTNEGSGNPIFSSPHPPKNQDILAAALADTDVFQPEQVMPSIKVQQSQLSPGYINVNNVLETNSMNSPIMTPLEVPSTNTKKIDDDILQVPKNVDLPITITDPNIAQTVANQQAALMSADLHSNLELPLAIQDVAVTSAGLNSPSFGYTMEDIHKPYSGSISMPLLTTPDDSEDVATTSASVTTVSETLPRDIIEQPPKTTRNSDPMKEEYLLTAGLSISNQMCTSLSEPPPDMFDFGEPSFDIRRQQFIDKLSTSNINSPGTDDSCEIPMQPEIISQSVCLTSCSPKRSFEDDDSIDAGSKKCKFD